MDTLTTRLTPLELQPKFGKVAQMVMQIPQAGVSTPPMKDKQQKRTPTPLNPEKPMVPLGRAKNSYLECVHQAGG